MMFTCVVNTIPTVVTHHAFYNKQNISRCAAHILVTVTLSAKHHSHKKWKKVCLSVSYDYESINKTQTNDSYFACIYAVQNT